MDCDGADAAPVLGVEGLFILGEMVVDCVGDTRGVYDIVPVQDEGVVALVAVMAVEAVEPDHCLGDGPLGVGGFGVVIVVVEVVGDLGGEGTTLLTYSPSSFLSASGSAMPSGRTESARLTLLRLFSELDLLILGGSSMSLLSLGADSGWGEGYTTWRPRCPRGPSWA